MLSPVQVERRDSGVLHKHLCFCGTVTQVTIKVLRAGDVRFRTTVTTAELERNVEEAEVIQLHE